MPPWWAKACGGGADGVTGCCGHCIGRRRGHTCRASLLCVSACGLPSDARTQMQMGTAGSGEAFLLGKEITAVITLPAYFTVMVCTEVKKCLLDKV